MEEENDTLEILDTENYKGGKDQMFSHQSLVMRIMNKCIEAGAKEMRAGYYNEKYDKFGNKILIYNPDTRKELIESIKTCQMIMVCDLDDTAKENIKKIKEKLDKEFKDLCESEKTDWENSSVSIKRYRWGNGIFYQKSSLNIKLSYYQDYIDFEIDCYREIFSELTELTKRVDFYQTQDYEV